jgi:hypothetical protein
MAGGLTAALPAHAAVGWAKARSAVPTRNVSRCARFALRTLRFAYSAAGTSSRMGRASFFTELDATMVRLPA